jgi:hypothetical protein
VSQFDCGVSSLASARNSNLFSISLDAIRHSQDLSKSLPLWATRAFVTRMRFELVDTRIRVSASAASAISCADFAVIVKSLPSLPLSIIL